MTNEEAAAALREAMHHINEALRLTLGVAMHYEGLDRLDRDMVSAHRPAARRWSSDLGELAHQLLEDQ